MEGASVRLLQLENAFYRSCIAVRLSGVELAEIRSFLLRELLAMATRRSKIAGRERGEAEERIKRLQERSEQQELKLSELHEQIQRCQTAQPKVEPDKDVGMQPVTWTEEEACENCADMDVDKRDRLVGGATVGHFLIPEHEVTNATSTCPRMPKKRKRRVKCVVGCHRKTLKRPKKAPEQELQSVVEAGVLPCSVDTDEVTPPASVAMVQKKERRVYRKVRGKTKNSIGSHRVMETPIDNNNTSASPMRTESDHEPSPEIPLQSHPRSRVVDAAPNLSVESVSLRHGALVEDSNKLARCGGKQEASDVLSALVEDGVMQIQPLELTEVAVEEACTHPDVTGTQVESAGDAGSQTQVSETRLAAGKGVPSGAMGRPSDIKGQPSDREVSAKSGGGKKRRTTLLNRKSGSSQLSVVDDEMFSGRRLTIKVSTRGCTAPKLKKSAHSDYNT